MRTVLDNGSPEKTATLVNAVWYSCGANRDHDAAGLPRTNADKRRAVETALRAKPTWSDNKIAEHVGVGHAFVSKMRPIIFPPKKDEPAPAARKGCPALEIRRRTTPKQDPGRLCWPGVAESPSLLTALTATS